jgi:hypothetical protein
MQHLDSLTQGSGEINKHLKHREWRSLRRERSRLEEKEGIQVPSACKEYR